RDEPRSEAPVEREEPPAGPLHHPAEDSAGPDGARPRSVEVTKSLLAEFADAGLLAHLAAQVIELRAVDVADRPHLDLVDLGRVERERPLDADAEGTLTDGEGLADAGALALDHDALEHLDPPAGALDHAEMDAHRVAGLEAGHVAQLTALEFLDRPAHEKGPGGAGAGCFWVEVLGGGREGAEPLASELARGPQRP